MFSPSLHAFSSRETEYHEKCKDIDTNICTENIKNLIKISTGTETCCKCL